MPVPDALCVTTDANSTGLREGILLELNQGLVDGTVEPDRWTMHRVTGKVVSHSSAHRDKYVVRMQEGVQLAKLPDDMASMIREDPMLLETLGSREYDLPCVTGVPNATTLIRTGNALSVDGYLGIVTIG